MTAAGRVAAVRSRLRHATPGAEPVGTGTGTGTDTGIDTGIDTGTDVVALASQVERLTARVDLLQESIGALSAELLDARSQGRRIGEISDVVTELLAHEASRHDPEFARILERFLDDPLPDE